MTNEEFSLWSRRLFIAFPSLWDWLQSNSPEPLATQAIWRKCLSPYSLDECMSVIERWTTGGLEPFAAYERDKVHLIVRSICSLDRDRKHKREEQAEINGAFYDKAKRGLGVNAIGCGSLLDSTMAAAAREGAVEYKRMLDGEITRIEYEDRRSTILQKHGLEVANAQPV